MLALVNRHLASVLTIVLALSGAWAGPVRAVESTRLVVSIVCIADEQDEIHASVAVGRPAPSTRAPLQGPAVTTTPLSRIRAHALFQRPPPPDRYDGYDR
jgi:hypothetical protein